MQNPVIILSSSPPAAEIQRANNRSLLLETTAVAASDIKRIDGDGQASKRRKTDQEVYVNTSNGSTIVKGADSILPIKREKDIWEVPSSGDEDIELYGTKVNSLAKASLPPRALVTATPKTNDTPTSSLFCSSPLLSPSTILKSIVTVPKKGSLVSVGETANGKTSRARKQTLKRDGGKNSSSRKKENIPELKGSPASVTVQTTSATCLTNDVGNIKGESKAKGRLKNRVTKRPATVSSHFGVSKRRNSLKAVNLGLVTSWSNASSSKETTASVTSVGGFVDVSESESCTKEGGQSLQEAQSPSLPAVPRRKDNWTPVNNSTPLIASPSVIVIDSSSQPMQNENQNTQNALFWNTMDRLRYSGQEPTKPIDASTSGGASIVGRLEHEKEIGIYNGVGATRRRCIETLDRPNIRSFTTISTNAADPRPSCSGARNNKTPTIAKSTKSLAKRKRKAQTITLLATEQYREPKTPSSSNTVLQFLSPKTKVPEESKSLEAGETLKALKVPKKRRTKSSTSSATTKKKPKKLLREEQEEVLLLSPQSAIRQVNEQVYEFGTLSQLLQDYDEDQEGEGRGDKARTTNGKKRQRKSMKALRESCDSDNYEEDLASRSLEEFLEEEKVSMSSKEKKKLKKFGFGPVASMVSEGKKGLWTAATRDFDGGLMDAGISKSPGCGKARQDDMHSDFGEAALRGRRKTRSPSLSKSWSITPARRKSGGTKEVNDRGVTVLDLVDTPLSTMKATRRRSNSTEHPKEGSTVPTEISIFSDKPRSKRHGKGGSIDPDCEMIDMTETPLPVAKRKSQASPKPDRQNPNPQGPPTARVQGQPRKPDFESFTTAELVIRVSKYGFRPIKNRTRLIEILDKCWEGEQKRKEAISADKIKEIEQQIERAKEIKPISKGKGRGRGIARKEAASPSSANIRKSVNGTASELEGVQVILNPESEAESIMSSSSTSTSKRSHSSRRSQGNSSTSPSGRVVAIPKRKTKKKKRSSSATKSSPRKRLSKVMKYGANSIDAAYFPLITHAILSQSQNSSDNFSRLGQVGKKGNKENHKEKERANEEDENQTTELSWRERILMYQPLVLEHLCEWLNGPQGIQMYSRNKQFGIIFGEEDEYEDEDGRRGKGGKWMATKNNRKRMNYVNKYKDSEVTIGTVKAWAENRGVCVCYEERGRR